LDVAAAVQSHIFEATKDSDASSEEISDRTGNRNLQMISLLI